MQIYIAVKFFCLIFSCRPTWIRMRYLNWIRTAQLLELHMYGHVCMHLVRKLPCMVVYCWDLFRRNMGCKMTSEVWPLSQTTAIIHVDLFVQQSIILWRELPSYGQLTTLNCLRKHAYQLTSTSSSTQNFLNTIHLFTSSPQRMIFVLPRHHVHIKAIV